MPRKKRLVDRDLRRPIYKTLNFHKFIVWVLQLHSTRKETSLNLPMFRVPARIPSTPEDPILFQHGTQYMANTLDLSDRMLEVSK